MTVVHLDTGEIVEPLTFDQAIELTEQIRVAADDLFALLVKAYHGRVWEALDYKSWDDYRATEFGHAPLSLPREERPEMVASLREHGLSLRAISSVTGASVNTIRGDLDEVYQSDTPTPITGIDGKEYAPTKPVRLNPSVATTEAEAEKVSAWSAATSLAEIAALGSSPHDPAMRAREVLAIADRSVLGFPSHTQLRQAARYLDAVADLLEQEEK